MFVCRESFFFIWLCWFASNFLNRFSCNVYLHDCFDLVLEQCVSVKILRFFFTFVYQGNLSQFASQEDLQYCGRDDILGKALNVPEHPGRVRAVGFGVSQKVYFNSRKRPQEYESESVKKMRQELNDLRNLVHELMKNSGQAQKKADVQPGDSPCYSGEGSCPPSPVILPEVATTITHYVANYYTLYIFYINKLSMFLVKCINNSLLILYLGY